MNAPNGQVAQHAVGDLEDAGELVERLGLGVELEQAVGAVRLLLDLVGELAPAPRLLADPRTAAAFHQLTGARDDLGLTLLGEVRVEQEQDLVVVLQPLPPSVWTAPPGLHCGAGVRGRVASAHAQGVRGTGRGGRRAGGVAFLAARAGDGSAGRNSGSPGASVAGDD